MHPAPTRARRLPKPSRSRRGLTMLEVVFAVLLLGLVATSTASLLSLSTRLHTDSMQRLGAYEVANRIVLLHLDDRNTAPRSTDIIPQGNYRYRFSLTEEPVKMNVKQTAAAIRSQGQVPLDRFKHITVKVWIVDDNPANTYAAAGEQMAELTRLYDPLADLFRNPDSRDRLVSTPDGLRRFIQNFSNITPAQQQPQQQPSTPTPGGGRR